MLPLNLRKLDCDFYTASCHKWLSAPFGSGFLYVAPRQQKRIQPAIVSWGGSIGGRQPGWKDEFNWLGTRNPAAFLATMDAIRFLRSSVSSFSTSPADGSEPNIDRSLLDEFRQYSASLVNGAVGELGQTVGTTPLIVNSASRSNSMMSLVLPHALFPTGQSVGKAGQRHPLQDWLWQNHQIEIPIIQWGDRLLIRISAHLYNSPAEYSLLAHAVREFAEQASSNG